MKSFKLAKSDLRSRRQRWHLALFLVFAMAAMAIVSTYMRQRQMTVAAHRVGAMGSGGFRIWSENRTFDSLASDTTTSVYKWHVQIGGRGFVVVVRSHESW